MNKDRKFWNEAVETLSAEQMKALQWRRLKEQLQYNYDYSIYYREEKKKDPGFLLFSEAQMNSLGYAYLFRGETKEAILLFQLNTEAYPESFNVYDSLGEAYMEHGQYDLATKFYKRSVEIYPGNTNGEQKLRELRKLINAN